MRSHYPHLVRAFGVVCAACALSAAEDLALFDFENPDALSQWQNEGEAFAVASASAPYYGRQRIENVRGESFLYSFDPVGRTNTPVGTLTSPPFKIERDYINFILGGGRGFPSELGAQLVIDGNVVRSSTGRESRPAISFKMLPLNWDVRAFKGKTARVVFNDKTPYGSLGADAFEQSDTPKGWRSDATRLYDETYRPAYHASAPRGWLNDPNGMFYYDGKWFLGYQSHYVDSAGTGWGLWVSDDLFHWTAKGESIPVGLTGSAFSGGACVDWQNTSGLKKTQHPPILLCYTLLPPGNGAYPDTPFSRQPRADDTRFYPALAYSVDGGKTWVKDIAPLFRYGDEKMLTYDKANLYTLDGGKTWVKDPSIFIDERAFKNDRDGKIFWYAPTKDWVMIWHLSQNNNRPNTAYGLYRSKDLKKWQLFQTIPGMWECPDMFEMAAVDAKGRPTGKKYWVMPRGGVEYFVGTFDGKRFVPMTINDPKNPYRLTPFEGADSDYDKNLCLRRVTYKSGCYAAQTFADAPDGRKVQVFWLNESKTSDNAPGSPFENIMSVPLELTLRDTGNGLVLERAPAREIENLYARTHTLKNVTLKEGATPEPFGLKTGLLDIDVTFDAGDAKKFGLEVFGEKILYDVKSERLFAFRETDPKTGNVIEKSTPVKLENGKISLRILVDRCSIEIFINRGVFMSTQLIYPQTDDPKLVFLSEGGRATAVSLKIAEIETSQTRANTPDKFEDFKGQAPYEE